MANPNHNISLDATIKPGDSPNSRSSPKPKIVSAEIHEIDDDADDDDADIDDAKTKALAKVKKDLMIQ